jgi:hypothetical protein
MTIHAHTWTLINSPLRRYRCTGCNVIGYALVNRRSQILPYKCQQELEGRKHCAAPATFVGHFKTQHRCQEHEGRA